MFSPNIHRKNLDRVMTRLVILAVLLPSVNVFAASPVTSSNAGVQGTSASRQEASIQVADTGNGMQQANAANRKTVNLTSSGTPRAFKDDYERILVRVGTAHDTQPVWLGKHYRKDNAKLSKVIWLSGKGGGD